MSLSPQMVDRAAAPRRGIARRVHDFVLRPEASVIVVSVALVVYFEIANANFLTNDNLQTVSQFVAAPVIIACGEIMLLICREIDLSVGQVFALAPFIMEHAEAIGLPVVAAIVAALAVCALIGLAIGLITIGLKRAVVHHHARHAVPDHRGDLDDLARLSRPTRRAARS